MNKIFSVRKLKTELIWCLVFSFAISTGIFFILQTAGENILDRYFYATSFIENEKNLAVAQFQTYVSKNNLKVNDHNKIEKWVRSQKDVIIYIYKGKKLIYASDGNNTVTDHEEYPESPIEIGNQLYDIQFADTKAQMYMVCFFEYKYYYLISFLFAAIAFFCFILIMLFFINRKTSYIGVLENEIRILEGGDLDYQITIEGNDELSSLAQGINEMRKSFIERLASEDEARLANSELVTAMSHDLRTPLTALIGYLDIIEYNKYKTDEDLTHYIHNSREKAYQIKYLSDQLFEYFTVYNTNEDILELETFEGGQLLEQLINDQLLILQNSGFDFEFASSSTPFSIEVNLISLRRVFDNIFSNIAKYADKSMPVKIKYYIENQCLLVYIENRINNNLRIDNSTGIGMKTCEKIIEKHKGKITVIRTENTYSVQIKIAIKPNSNRQLSS